MNFEIYMSDATALLALVKAGSINAASIVFRENSTDDAQEFQQPDVAELLSLSFRAKLQKLKDSGEKIHNYYFNFDKDLKRYLNPTDLSECIELGLYRFDYNRADSLPVLAFNTLSVKAQELLKGHKDYQCIFQIGNEEVRNWFGEKAKFVAPTKREQTLFAEPSACGKFSIIRAEFAELNSGSPFKFNKRDRSHTAELKHYRYIAASNDNAIIIAAKLHELAYQLEVRKAQLAWEAGISIKDATFYNEPELVLIGGGETFTYELADRSIEFKEVVDVELNGSLDDIFCMAHFKIRTHIESRSQLGVLLKEQMSRTGIPFTTEYGDYYISAGSKELAEEVYNKALAMANELYAEAQAKEIAELKAILEQNGLGEFVETISVNPKNTYVKLVFANGFEWFLRPGRYSNFKEQLRITTISQLQNNFRFGEELETYLNSFRDDINK